MKQQPYSQIAPVLIPAGGRSAAMSCGRALFAGPDALWVALAFVSQEPGADAQARLLPDLRALSETLKRDVRYEEAEYLAATMLTLHFKACGARIEATPAYPSLRIFDFPSLASSIVALPELLEQARGCFETRELFAAVPSNGTVFFAGRREDLPELRAAIRLTQSLVPPAARVSDRVFRIRDTLSIEAVDDEHFDPSRLLPMLLRADAAAHLAHDRGRHFDIEGIPEKARPWITLAMPTDDPQRFDWITADGIASVRDRDGRTFTFDEALTRSIANLERRCMEAGRLPERESLFGFLKWIDVGVAASVVLLPNLLRLAHQMLGTSRMLITSPMTGITFFAPRELEGELSGAARMMSQAVSTAERLTPIVLHVDDGIVTRGRAV